MEFGNKVTYPGNNNEPPGNSIIETNGRTLSNSLEILFFSYSS